MDSPSTRLARSLPGGLARAGHDKTNRATNAASLLRHASAGVRLRHRTVQALLGHSDVKPTMIYMHVLGLGASAVRSPLDVLAD